MNREEALKEVGKCVLTDRNLDYGAPEDNFSDIAARWNIYLKRRGLLVSPLTAADVAVMSIDIKMSRLATSPNKLDHWVDVAGYAVCGAEIVTKEPDDAAIVNEINHLVFGDDA